MLSIPNFLWVLTDNLYQIKTLERIIKYEDPGKFIKFLMRYYLRAKESIVR